MCGIAGFLAPEAGWNREELHRVAGSMADCLRHRGPDDEGTWADPDAGLALGHRRLAVLDVSPLGHQPMESASGGYVLSYNGEIYNFRQLRRDLESRGHAFRGQSDTEVVLAAFEEFGIADTLPRLNGMFAMSVWDRERRELWLARDRLGQKPLYVGTVSNAVLFASELTPLHRFPGFDGEVDRDALTLLLRRGCIAAPRSIYRNVRKLAPGHYMRLRADDLDPMPVCYWSLADIALAAQDEPFEGNVHEAAEELDSLLREAVRYCMVSDVPVGAFLSGGVDSSTVAALMSQVANGPVKTFSIGFGEADFDEAPHAARVAAHLGTDHTELYVSQADARSVIPDLPTLYDEPFADASQIPTYLVSKLARSDVTVALSGDGGDELFCGYAKYHYFDRLRRLGSLPGPARRAAIAGLSLVPGDKLRQAATLLDAAESPAAIYVHLASIWKRPIDLVPGAVEPRTWLTDTGAWPPLRDPVRQVMTIDALSYLPDDILVKVDRAAMAVSLETRIPLLDHRVVEFAAALPVELCYDGKTSKRPLRALLDRYVPADLLARPKMGFDPPLGSWLRNELKDWAGDLLSRDVVQHQGYLHADTIERTWARHLSGERDLSGYLWPILMFQAWCSQHLVAGSRD